MFKHNITIVQNTQRPDLNGNCPVRIRTTIKRKVQYYPTGISVKKEQFDKGVIIHHPNRTLLNSTIIFKKNEIERELLESNIIGGNVVKVRANNNISFNEYATKNLNKNKGLLSASTIKHKQSYLRKILDFKPNLKLADVNKDLVMELEDYCRSIGNIPNTVWSCTKFLKTVINAAVDDGTLAKNPLKGFKGTKYSDPLRSVLTQSEIDKLEEFADNPLNNPKLINTVAWFILGCYTGLRYADMVNFKGLVNGKVLLQTQKTDSIVSIYATEQIKRAVLRLNKPIYSNQKCNAYISICCAALGIEKKISFHNSRHSFSVLFLENGGDLYKLSKLLGHSNIKTTSIYSKISSVSLDAEMKKVWTGNK
jgi:site-specific recombinase XerD